MKTQTRDPEPSMDEILASIRQIISGDPQEAQRNPLASGNDDDILDLTHPLPEERGKSSPLKSEKQDPLKSKISSPLRENPKSSNPPIEEPLVSLAAASEATQALHELNKYAQKSSRFSEPLLHEGMGGKTVESLVREILRPLLKEWLDTHLPTLVKWVVNEQVERIVRQMAQQEHSAEKEKQPFQS